MKAAKRALLTGALAALAFGLSWAQTPGIQFYGPLARVITPNGDGINDLAYFCFENPQDDDISGKIYSLLGSEVASVSPRRDRVAGVLGGACPAAIIRAQFVTWDGTSGGVRVRSGIYVYRIKVEEKVFTGTLLVVR